MRTVREKMQKNFDEKRCLVIGGSGFIGSNLVYMLLELGAKVTIVTRNIKKINNLHNIQDQIDLLNGDIKDQDFVNSAVQGFDYIFNLAAQVSYLDSIKYPRLDLETNCLGHLNVLEAMKNYNPSAKVLFTSSRLVYGKIKHNPVAENHPTDPLSIYGAHKLVAEKYYTIYHQIHNLNTVVVRIPNPYGPRQWIKDMHSGAIVGWIMYELMNGREVKIFGDGNQKRSYLYIDDLIEALLLLISNPKAVKGEIFNVGTSEIYSFQEMVKTIYSIIQKGSYKNVPWPKDFEKNETGDYIPNLKKIKKYTGFTAKISLTEGVQKMVDFYTANKLYYC